MAGDAAEQLGKPIPLRVFHLAVEEGCREFVSFIAHDQVIATFRNEKFLLHILITGQLIEARNGKISFEKPVT